MSPDECIKVLATARAAYPGMSMVEGMPQVWHGALGDLRLEECQRAIIAHTKASSTIVTPADIRKLVQSSRTDAAMRVLPEGRDGRRPMSDNFWTLVAKSKAENAEKWAEVRRRNGITSRTPTLGGNYGGMR
jgi:hypothetical protein